MWQLINVSTPLHFSVDLTFGLTYHVLFNAGCIPVMMAAVITRMRFMTGAANKSDKLYQRANQLMTEAFSSIRVVHAYNLQPYMYSSYGQTLVGTGS